MLILLSELAQGCDPALYLAPDNYLVSQVRAKRQALARLGEALG